MAKLIKIAEIADKARAAGLRVNGGGRYCEIFTPAHLGAEAIWHGGSQYSTADIVISDSASIGYGYNPFFYGPFHPGFCRSDDSGVVKLLSSLER